MATASARREQVIHWFRSDLRLGDNRALAAAASRADALALVFVLDDRLLHGDAVGPPRRRFLVRSLVSLATSLAARGHRLRIHRGDPVAVVPALARALRADRITWNRDDGAYARRRDAAVRAAAARDGVAVEEHKDRVVFESGELRTRAGDAFRVYTPFRNAWWARFREEPQEPLGPLRLPEPLTDDGLGPGEPLADTEEDPAELPPAGEAAALRRLERFLAGPAWTYAERRDRPDLDGTSRLSPHLRFGAISIRRCVHRALARMREEPRAAPGLRRWLDELVWREFYHAVRTEHPDLRRRALRRELDGLAWEEDPGGFEAWCRGRTGFPFVDAAMRQLAATGWIHNRARMVAASFLTKDLGIDWRRGERFFMQRLVDGDPASNAGGWQWAASTGTDAQPWFRVFHPVRQGERFDPEGRYVRRFVPELRACDDRFVQRPWEAVPAVRGYPRPIVDHAARRLAALRRFEALRARAGRRHGRRPSCGPASS